MSDANHQAGSADLERLAARLGMLASEDGEADNAGRAVGAMARRIGLTGGDLKRIFLAGAGYLPLGPVERLRLEHEIATLQDSLALLEADARRATRERDALRAENASLRGRIELRRAARRGWALGGGFVAVVLAILAAGASTGELDRKPPAPAAEAGASRGAMVRPGGAMLFGAPERVGPPVVVLSGGQRVQVRRLLWKALYQWAEVEMPDGRVGYVLTTELDLS